ncbi:choice-of-anchor tandem repeat GloVer-containing protein [Reichenbachiella versicolor]|uniref:choice-of-anchor tandem repeat GloVer-containing protein n=1 Tax=Reichenbachiella versicolor TaxID=1821036 RepID=UPI000D6E1913|nr:choice-of-anchor tandem repeat GloVer-containing protein [Reichenbachiella versicolor]
MKKTILFIALAILTHGLSAQVTELWGVTPNSIFQGTIFKLDVNKEFQSVAYVPSDGQNSESSLIEGETGVFYGMTRIGGALNKGVIFSYTPSDSKYQVLHVFSGQDGQYPTGSLIKATDGLFYGVTSTGGTSDNGVLFSYDAQVGIYSVLYHFKETDELSPIGSLLEGSDGKLYGLTSSSGDGTIFSFNPVDNTFEQLYALAGKDGNDFEGSLIEASNGLLYGMTQYGGDGNTGVIFSFNTSNNTYSKVHDFGNTLDGHIGGEYPQGALMEANDGKLYGVAGYGGTSDEGVIFSYDLSGTSGFTVVHYFDGSNGSEPNGSLIQASNGKLYGTTGAGGSSRYGVLFSYDLSGSGFNVEYNYSRGGNRVYSIAANVIEAQDGKFYGIGTRDSSYPNYGGIYSIDLSSTANYSTLYKLKNSFGQGLTGLTMASDGIFYGVAAFGGEKSNGGVIFSIDRSNNQYSKLYDFDGSNSNPRIGFRPQGTLVEGDEGLLYGVTRWGGRNSYGVIFEYNTNEGNYTVLHHFDDKERPTSSLIMGKNGKLYGSTAQGGKSNAGILFSYDLGGAGYLKLADFFDIGAESSRAPLVEGDDNLLYGTTIGGGSQDGGVLFSYNLTANELVSVYEFNGTSNGDSPYSLVKSRKGTLYGTTLNGGSNGKGTIYSYEPANSTYTKLHDFDGTTGGHSYAGLEEDQDGVLYGVTSEGGASDAGVLFSFNTNDGTYTKIHDFVINEGNARTSLVRIRTCEPKDHTLISRTVDCQFEAPTINDDCLGLLTGTIEKGWDFEANEGVTKDIVWTFDDTYGNYIEATQSITFDDVTNPVPDLEELPEIISDKEILESSIVIPTATDDCSSNITVTHDIEFPITRSVKINWTFDDNHGNKISQTQNVVINSTLSVGEDLESDFTVYPNPASGIITINSTSSELVQVLSLEGVVLLSSDKKTVDISTLSTGIYIIKQGSKVTQFIKE